jgi:Zn-dependent metalloprotease
MRFLRVVLPVSLAVAAAAPAQAAVQQSARDRFVQDATGVRIVSSPATAGASTVTGTVTTKRLGVSTTAGPGAVARAAIERYPGLLGVSSGELRYDGATTDALGRHHVRFEQVASGVPVYDGTVTVHLARDADALTASPPA